MKERDFLKRLDRIVIGETVNHGTDAVHIPRHEREEVTWLAL